MKKIILIVVPVVLIGAVLGLAFLGVIDIPGISPKKKPKNAIAKKEPEKKAPIPKPKTDAPLKNPQKGYDAVAKLWNELEPTKVVPLIDKWKDDELAAIFMKMDPEKVTAILSELKPERAAQVTRAIQRRAESAV